MIRRTVVAKADVFLLEKAFALTPASLEGEGEARIGGMYSRIKTPNRTRTAPVPIGQAQRVVPKTGRAGSNALGRPGPLRLVLAHTAAVRFMRRASQTSNFNCSPANRAFPRFCATILALCFSIISSFSAEPARPDPLARIADPQPTPPRVDFADGKFLLRTNEVVVFTGSANVVYEQQQGWLETLLAFAGNQTKINALANTATHPPQQSHRCPCWKL
jgi:hypothetical protein